MKSTHWDEMPVGACTQAPERWTSAVDEEAKAICRACPRRWLCAAEACELPRSEGMWAGIFVPEAGRGRTFALRQLRSLAEQHGVPVRQRRLYYAESA
jgi:WhiB family redox-sensing transcriptional regulator